VLTEHFGLEDLAVRNWTNGPAWLTWSRGQNSHGNGIGGPLPRSFMKGQWSLQRQILARYRALGIVGHLPAFGGYAPWALAVAQNATNRVAQGKVRGVAMSPLSLSSASRTVPILPPPTPSLSILATTRLGRGADQI
jgi:hypothetical protein